MKKKTTGEEGKKKRPSKLKTAFRVLLILSAGSIAAGVILFAVYFKVDEWHTFDPDLITGAARSTVFYDAEGNEISIMHSSDNRIPIEIESLPEYVKYAFTSAEDARFYEHSGIDIIRIGGAALADIKAGGKVQGASTIGQQLIKLSHLSPDKTFERKVEEAYLSICMEHRFSKDEILEMYMNYVYFGGGFYGIETASRGYFGVSASELSIAQAAQLAGIVKAPSRYAPHLNMEKSVGRRDTVLKLMLDYGRITEEEYNSAINEECVLTNNMVKAENYFIDYAIDECCRYLEVDRNELLCGGYQVYTTLATDINEEAEQLVKHSEGYPEGSENSEGALAALRVDGSIAAMVGGREYSSGCFNRASEMERQPGSLMKPIICYAPAMEYCGVTAATMLDDEPMDFDGYSPRNAGDVYCGKVSVRRAIEESLNIPAVEMLDSIGLGTGVAFSERLGISFDDECISLALALGGFTYGVSPLEMAGAYNTFASGGEYIEPYSVSRIERDGETLYAHEAKAERVMSEANAYILTDMLSSAAENGTAKRLGETGLHVAAKTGTNLDSNGNVRDAWTAAYTSEYTIVMWMGMDNASLGALPSGTTGGSSSCVVIAELLSAIYDGGNSDFTIPDGVIEVSLDKNSMEEGELLLATEYMPKEQVVKEVFTLCTAPMHENPFWQYPSAPEQVGWYFDVTGKPVITFTSDDARLSYAIYRRDRSGYVIRIATLSGCSGPVEYRDVSALLGSSYEYYITKIHPNMAENGRNIESEPSRCMYVIMGGQ